MNPDAISLIERSYQDIVDDILTAIVGGVVNEPFLFDVTEDSYPLSKKAADVRGISGTLEGKPFAFLKGADFVFKPDGNAVAWRLEPGAKHPDDQTSFYVDYFLPEGNSPSPLSDINVGSVVRTLSEAIGREIATLYQQVNLAYLSGFIDTARGKSLDLVVSILGIKRKTKEFAVGMATFFRDPAMDGGNVSIPEGLVLCADKGASFATTELRTLQRGQARIDVPIRAGDAFKGEAGMVKSGGITRLAQPIAGISRVTNFEDILAAAEDESDEQLRSRARAGLSRLGKATLASLAAAVLESHAKLIEIRDPCSPLDKRTTPGSVTLVVDARPNQLSGLFEAVHQSRAAGIQVNVAARCIFFALRLIVSLEQDMSGLGKESVRTEIVEALQSHVDALGAGKPACGADMLDVMKKLKVKLKKVQIRDVRAWKSDVGNPAAAEDALLDALLDAVAASKDEDGREVRRQALRNALAAAPSGGSGLVPDRGAVQGASGSRATDAEIEAGEFKVVPPDKDWFVALEMKPADIELKE